MIFNTCSIRELSQKKVFYFLKKNKKKFLNIFNGCLSNIYFYLLLKKKYINLIIDNFTIFYLIYLLYYYYFYFCKQIFLKNNNFNNFELLSQNFTIILMEGCNKYCSYCIIPYTKGREDYYNIFFILKKIYFQNNFFLELFFLGQNINYYKFYLFNKIFNFYFFLKICFELSLNYLINYITSNPKNLIFYFSYYKNFNFIHIPLQSASNIILKYMNRNYSLNYYKNFIYFIKYNYSNFLNTSDFIICFPKELNIFFNKTILSLEKLLFDKSYIFIYNIRSFTSSIYFFNNINYNLKKYRYLKINNKIKCNMSYIIKTFYNKIYFLLIKSICLIYNNIFYSFINNKFIYYFLNVNFLKIKKFILFNIKKIILKKIFSCFL
ncbi:hypothetical protein CU086_00755 [Candidatus Nasuia deltocephalinicola]|uniref:Uncharacterized protein n=1 Tax=Candidatus Nasuia deltocephalincola TaxID=1160784 RepID=A0A974WKL3_9PROT|nr:hypothetical protein CU086_00755 [Candidatus Nasuia deltocephalinicola]